MLPRGALANAMVSLTIAAPRARPGRDYRHAEVGRGASHLCELLLGCGEAGPQAVDFAEPATAGARYDGRPAFHRLVEQTLTALGAALQP